MKQHILFFLKHSSPFTLLSIPGGILIFFSILISSKILSGAFEVFGIGFYAHTMIVMSFIFILGLQMVFNGVISSISLYHKGLLPTYEKYELIIKDFSFKKIFIMGLLVSVIGCFFFLDFYVKWFYEEKSRDYGSAIIALIPALTLLVSGGQITINSFSLYWADKK